MATQEPAESKGSEHLNLKVKSQDGNEVYFKVAAFPRGCIVAPRKYGRYVIPLLCGATQVKRTTQLKKLMEAYCARVGTQSNQVRFLFDGIRIKPEQTPEDVRVALDIICSCDFCLIRLCCCIACVYEYV